MRLKFLSRSYPTPSEQGVHILNDPRGAFQLRKDGAWNVLMETAGERVREGYPGWFATMMMISKMEGQLIARRAAALPTYAATFFAAWCE